MYEYAGITGYKPDRDGTHLKIFIPDRHLEEAIVKKRIKDKRVKQQNQNEPPDLGLEEEEEELPEETIKSAKTRLGRDG